MTRSLRWSELGWYYAEREVSKQTTGSIRRMFPTLHQRPVLEAKLRRLGWATRALRPLGRPPRGVANPYHYGPSLWIEPSNTLRSSTTWAPLWCLAVEDIFWGCHYCGVTQTLHTAGARVRHMIGNTYLHDPTPTLEATLACLIGYVPPSWVRPLAAIDDP